MTRCTTEEITELELLAADLEDGSTNRYYCIRCSKNMARTSDKTMAITREGNRLLFICYRATCGFKGTTGTSMNYIHDSFTGKSKDKLISLANANLSNSQVQMRKRITSVSKCKCASFVPNNAVALDSHYRWGLKGLTREMIEFFMINFFITEGGIKRNNIRYNSDLDSFAFPIYDPLGKEIGIVDRSYSGRSPKSIQYWHSNSLELTLHFPVSGIKSNNPTDCVYLVEDHLSAIRLADYTHVAALCGSYISAKNALSLSKMYDSIVLMLDNDATDKAIKQKIKYQHMFSRFDVRFLSKDIKNMRPLELKRYMSNG